MKTCENCSMEASVIQGTCQTERDGPASIDMTGRGIAQDESQEESLVRVWIPGSARRRLGPARTAPHLARVRFCLYSTVWAGTNRYLTCYYLASITYCSHWSGPRFTNSPHHCRTACCAYRFHCLNFQGYELQNLSLADAQSGATDTINLYAR